MKKSGEATPKTYFVNRVGKQGRKWIKFRKQFLKNRKNWKNEWDCEHCQTSTAYPEVDHILKRSSHPEAKYDTANLQILCNPCHQKETAKKP